VDAHEAHDRAIAAALEEVQAEDAAADRSPAAMRDLIAEQRARNAKAEARMLLAAGMTPQRVQEVLTEHAPEPLTDANCTVDPTDDGFRDLRHMILHAKANQRAWDSLTDEQRQQIEADRTAVEALKRTVRAGAAQPPTEPSPSDQPTSFRKHRPPAITTRYYI
jgi:hypothetical protein